MNCEKEMKDLLGALDEFVKAANKNYENVIVKAKEKGEPEELLNIVEAYVSTIAEVGIPLIKEGFVDMRKGVKGVRDKLTEVIELLDAIKHEDQGVIELRAEDLGIDDLKDYLDYQEYLRSDDYLGWQYEESDD